MSDLESKHGIKSNKIQVRVYNVFCYIKNSFYDNWFEIAFTSSEKCMRNQFC